MKTAAELIDVLMKAGYSRKDIADYVGVSAAWVGQARRGKGIPSLAVREKLYELVLKVARVEKEREEALKEAGFF